MPTPSPTRVIILLFLLATSQTSFDLLNILSHTLDYTNIPNSLNPTHRRTFDYLQDHTNTSQNKMVLSLLNTNQQITKHQHEAQYLQLKFTSDNKSAVVDIIISNKQWFNFSSSLNYTVRLFENNFLTQEEYICQGTLNIHLSTKEEKNQLPYKYKTEYQTQNILRGLQIGSYLYVSLSSSAADTSPKCYINVNSHKQLNQNSREDNLKMYITLFSIIYFVRILAAGILVWRIHNQGEDFSKFISAGAVATMLYSQSFQILGFFFFSYIMDNTLKYLILILQIVYILLLVYIFIKTPAETSNVLIKWLFQTYIVLVIGVDTLVQFAATNLQLWGIILVPCSMFTLQIYCNFKNKNELIVDPVYLIAYIVVLLGFNPFRSLYIYSSSYNIFHQEGKSKGSVINALFLSLILIVFILSICYQHFFYQKKNKQKLQEEIQHIQTQVIKKEVQKIINGLNFLQNVQRLRLLANTLIPNCGRCKKLITFDIESEIKKRISPNELQITSPLLQQQRKVYVCKLECGCVFHRICLLEFVTNNPNAEKCVCCSKELSQEIQMLQILI